MDKVRFEQPDLIVLDLMMEKHDTGFAVAKALRQTRSTGISLYFC